MDSESSFEEMFQVEAEARAVWVGDWLLGTWMPIRYFGMGKNPDHTFSNRFAAFVCDDPVLVELPSNHRPSRKWAEYVARKFHLYLSRSPAFLRAKYAKETSPDKRDHWWCYLEPSKHPWEVGS